MKRTDQSALKGYSATRWALIPLHNYRAQSTRHGRARMDGKRPLDANWTTKDYDTKKVLERCARDNLNVGVRLKPDQLVIDVDPRNGGAEGFENLCIDLGIDPSIFPHVITGSGGSHYYMSKDGDIPVRDTLPDWPGVEFKSRGRQVVAAGSIHPDTKDFYRWDETAPPLSELPPVPRRLIKLIARPQTSAVTGGGQYTQEQIARALNGLDPTKFAEHDKWLRLMMACHHASNGDARSEFIEWSTSDPHYEADAEIIGRRWDSLHKDKMDGVSYKTLEYALREAGQSNLQVANDVGDDFDGLDEFEGDESSEKRAQISDNEAPSEDWLEAGLPDEDVEEESPGGLTAASIESLEALNTKYVAVVEGSKFRIIYKAEDPILKRDYWVRMSPQDFMLKHSNQRIEREKKGLSKNAAETMPLGKAWIEWPGRNEVEGVLFDPTRERPGYLNLWDGFAYDIGRDGSWSILRDMIFEVLSDGDQNVYDYVMNWLRFMFQFPDQRAEVAIVFKGGMGVGKGTLGNVITKLIGRHAIAVASPELITGRFNSHLQDVIFLFADEAIKPYDKQAESRLKAFITEPLLAFEGKGRDAILGANFLHIMMATNESWAIPAALDERRFLVSNANNKWQRDFKKWDALHDQLKADNDSGYRRMLFDLMNTELPPRWHPRDVPTTQALIDEKTRSLTPLQMYFYNAASDGIVHIDHRRGPWETAPIRFFAEDFRVGFQQWCRENSINPGAMGRSNTRFLMQELRALFPGAETELRDKVPDDSTVHRSPSDGRAQTIELPSLAECRESFEARVRGKINWTGKTTENDFG